MCIRDRATPTELIFNLYLAYCEVTKNKDYEFDKFIHWGNILVTDFNDVDQYMVDAKQLFSNISDWKEISTDYLPDELKAELRRYLNMKLEAVSYTHLTVPSKLWAATPNPQYGVRFQ